MADEGVTLPARSRFGALGVAMYRCRRLVVVLWVLSFVVSMPVLLKVEEPLKVGGFSSNRTEAARARHVVEQELSGSASQLVVIFKSNGESISSDAVKSRMSAAIHRSRTRLTLPT